jgi:AcrR family transcriptional regulator
MELTAVSPSPVRVAGRPRDAAVDAAVTAAVAELLDEVGYPALTIELVARRAGVGKPAIYRRWAGKPALVVDVLAVVLASDPVPDTGSLRGDLEALWADLLAFWSKPRMGQNVTGLLVDLVDHPEAAATFRTRVLDPRAASVVRMLDRALARGEIASRQQARWAAGLLEGALVEWDLFGQGPVPEEYGAFVLAAVLGAVGQPVQGQR